jgi:hypothetical protein
MVALKKEGTIMVNESLRQMRSTVLTLTLILTLTLAAGAQTLKSFTVRPYSTTVTAINDAGEVVGYYNSSPQGFAWDNYGFWRTPEGKIHKFTGKWTAHSSAVFGINSLGELVGGFGTEPAQAFYMIPPATKPTLIPSRGDGERGCGGTVCLFGAAVNDAGWIAGVGDGDPALDGAEGCFIETPEHTFDASLNWPEFTAFYCASINNLNQVAGGGTISGVLEGFMYDLNANTATLLNVPGAVSTSAAAINDSSEVVGGWTDANSVQHGFTWTSAGGYVSFDVPGAVNTWANGINASGAIIGGFNDSSAGCFQNAPQGCPQGFLLVNGTFTTIDVPKALITQLSGINSSGVVVGTSTTVNKSSGIAFSRGFLYTPAK